MALVWLVLNCSSVVRLEVSAGDMHGSVVEGVPCVHRDWALSPVLPEERLCQNVYQALDYECPSFLPAPNVEWISGFFFYFIYLFMYF